MKKKFRNVTLTTKANIWARGGVVSHTFHTADGKRRTVGIIFPGTYQFKTECAEKMTITVGLVGFRYGQSRRICLPGDNFKIPDDTEFELICDVISEYICEYLE